MERWRRMGVSRSLSGRRSEEKTQSNTSSRGGQKYLLSTRGMMAIEVPQNEEISGGRQGIGSAICWGGANSGGIHIKKRERGGVVKRNVDPYIIRVGIKLRKRGGRKFRKG